jgi:hypothetical protein
MDELVTKDIHRNGMPFFSGELEKQTLPIQGPTKVRRGELYENRQ